MRYRLEFLYKGKSPEADFLLYKNSRTANDNKFRKKDGDKMMEKAVGEKAYQNNEAYERTQMQKDMIIERLREQGCRITRQRQLILDIILGEECSCCKEIYYKVQEKDKNVGPATIYRMVNMLEKLVGLQMIQNILI